METLPYTHLVHTYTPTNKIISPVIQKIKLSLCPKRRVRIFFWFWGGSLRTWGQPPTHLLRWWGEVKIPTHSPPGWREVGTRYQPDQIIQLGCPPSTIKKRSSWTELRIIPLLSDPQGVTFHFQPPPPPRGLVTLRPKNGQKSKAPSAISGHFRTFLADPSRSRAKKQNVLQTANKFRKQPLQCWKALLLLHPLFCIPNLTLNLK